jgi:malate dehydrogenase (quinone)
MKLKLNDEVILIGAGIMSATLGVMLHELRPDIHIHIFEKLDEVAEESSDAWNNAGTGHSAFCELNYTPLTKDGVDISKAVKIADSFEMSREFWSYLVEKEYIDDPGKFIQPVPHMSCVWGPDIPYLKKRHEAMIRHPLFSSMIFSDEREQLREWMPLIMEGRPAEEKMAATYMEAGTDVNFGALTRILINYLKKTGKMTLHLDHDVKKLRKKNGQWKITVRDTIKKERKDFYSNFVFIGAGGGALPLLKKSKIPEGKGYGGFPVSGQWLICTNQAIINKHDKKVYGKASVGTPPMSVPHLDTRIIKGKKQLLFGPYAGFTTKFLKQGSPLDLIKSISLNNIIPMIAAGLRNIPLTKYLFQQVSLSENDRLKMLKTFIPTAKIEEWVLEEAGQRVQIIKKDKEHGGKLEFGTELVTSADGSVAALLGASPGASVSVSIIADLFAKCFAEEFLTREWQTKFNAMCPSYNMNPQEKLRNYGPSRERTTRVLELHRKLYEGKRSALS